MPFLCVLQKDNGGRRRTGETADPSLDAARLAALLCPYRGDLQRVSLPRGEMYVSSLAELRGSVDGPLAIGPIDVLVDEGGLDDARALLLLDEVEASFAGEQRLAPAPLTLRHALVVAGVVLLLLLFAL